MGGSIDELLNFSLFLVPFERIFRAIMLLPTADKVAVTAACKSNP